MKKTLISLAVIVVVIIAIVSFSGTNQDNGPIKIGFIGPLTGDASIYGTTEKNITDMLVEQVNQSGGIKGRSIQMIYEDGKCNGKDSATAAQKLINVDGVKYIFGGICSAETLGAAPLAEKSKVLLFSAFSSAPAITDAGDYVFRNSPSDNDSGKADAQLLAKKYKKIAIISEKTDYSTGLHQVLADLLSKAGVTIVDDESYSGDTKDFRTILIKVKDSNPDAVYFNPGTSPQVAGLLIKQARDLGITVPAYFNFFMGNSDTVKMAGASAEGVIFSDMSGILASQQSFLDDYKKRFNSAPGSEYELGASYDRATILINALKSVGDDSTKVKNYLYSIKNYDGKIGSYHFDQNGDVVGVGFSHFIIKDGKKTIYTE